ncbi:hypothetical protein B0H19DRAFT_714200 [Mycena capillaripes]|nr:hypothetical protein B0H19DRAFT_714200 [Mycena capillaripes]
MIPPSRPVLPPEVIDLVIDNLHDDLPTLRACSLVSRDWVGGSRHHLFDDGPYLTGRNLGVFRDLLESPYNTFSFHLRSLHATGFHYDDVTQLWPLLPGFSRLRSLHIDGNRVFDIALLGTQAFSSVDSLALSRAVFPSYPGLTTFLSRFPSLKTLKLDRVSTVTTGNTVKNAVLELNLDALQIKLTPEIFGWLRWTGFSLRAQSIEMDFETSEPGLAEYFNLLGTQLQQLKLKFRQPSQLAIFSEKSWLVHNTALRSLRISQAFWILGESNVGISASLGRLLRPLQSSGLQELAFDASFISHGINWDPSPPQEVAAILDGVGFEGLQRITFYGPWDRCDDILSKQFRSAICALLPMQVARGIVHVAAHVFK